MLKISDEVNDPTRVEIKEMLEKHKLITTPGSDLVSDLSHKECVALFDDGTFFVQREFKHDGTVLTIQARLQRANHRMEVVRPVSMDVLGQIYQMYREMQSPVGRGKVAAKEAAPMQRQFQQILGDACARRASDIHVVVSKTKATISLRIDSAVRESKQIPADTGADLCQAAFVAAEMSDASYSTLEYQMAQLSDSDGALPEKLQAIRMQFAPLANGGRYMVIRLLYKGEDGKPQTDLSALGYSESHQKLLTRMRGQSHGINFVTGPTGSGKSTTLNRMLTAHYIETGRRLNFLTVEDPPEATIYGAKQIPVTNATTAEQRRVQFGKAINAALRLDPDVIMVGEIRDRESAKLAFEAAMTGHVVYTTLHTNNAASIMGRLQDIGVEAYKVYDPDLVTGLVAQRLLPKLCEHCKIPYADLDAAALARYTPEQIARVNARFGAHQEDIFFLNAEGCDHCNKTGISGRTVAAEIVLPDEAYMAAVLAGNKMEARRIWIETLGGETMKRHGESKVMAGVVCPVELERYLGYLDDTAAYDPTRKE